MEENKEMDVALEREGIFLNTDVKDHVTRGRYHYAYFLTVDEEGDLAFAEKYLSDVNGKGWRGPYDPESYGTKFRWHSKVRPTNVEYTLKELDNRDKKLNEEIAALEAEIAVRKKQQTLIAHAKNKLAE